MSLLWRATVWVGWWLVVSGAGCGGDASLPSHRGDAGAVTRSAPDIQSGSVAQIKDARARLDKQVWEPELMAQHFGATIVELWDALRTADDAAEVLGDFEFGELRLASYHESAAFDYDVESKAPGPPDRLLSTAAWRTQLAAWSRIGYRLVQSEWHHEQFTLDATGQPRSVVGVVLHVENERLGERWILSGDVEVAWSRLTSDGGPPVADEIDARAVQALHRRGPLPFRLAATLPFPQSDGREFLAIYDLDHDGDAEILFGNHRYRNEGGGRFVAERIAVHRSEAVTTGLLADFDLDGRIDLLCVDNDRSPRLFIADSNGRFSTAPRVIDAIGKIELSIAVTAGDIDRDGDLDVWVSQYKSPYRGGQMPTPYFDANDGFPSYLLVNDGRGNLRDATREAGLEAKRCRRTYAASFVDLDDDHDLDLLVVSDFAGVDVYENDGAGRFRDVTGQWIDEPRNFGMSLALDDFDGDGHVDIFVAGMGSTTARRLDRMGLEREGFPLHNRMRSVMGYGNRIYLRRGAGYVQPDWSGTVARTGWSWGVGAADWDNDGDRDLFVANGHISGRSVRDYCSVFWRHDIYAGSSQEDPALSNFFEQTQADFQQTGSWNGFEHNCLLINRVDGQFVNIAFLLGVAGEFDSRNVVAADIDSDGKMDLVVVENSLGRGSVLHVIRNHVSNGNHWIGVRLVESPGRSNMGARVRVTTDARIFTRPIVSGDSFSSQHPAACHFGLGATETVEALEVRWVDGTRRIIENPAVDRYHTIRD